jgi:effector-binding domain-containing protein
VCATDYRLCVECVATWSQRYILDAAAPAQPAEEDEMTTFSIDTIEPQLAAAIRREIPMAELKETFDTGFSQVMHAITEQGATMAGPPFGYYHRMPRETVDVSIGFPVSTAVQAGDVEPFDLPGGRAVVVTHVGPYEDLESTYGELMAWVQSEGLKLAKGMWEQYLSDPATEPDPATWRTLIVWPLA